MSEIKKAQREKKNREREEKQTNKQNRVKGEGEN